MEPDESTMFWARSSSGPDSGVSTVNVINSMIKTICVLFKVNPYGSNRHWGPIKSFNSIEFRIRSQSKDEGTYRTLKQNLILFVIIGQYSRNKLSSNIGFGSILDVHRRKY